MRLIHHTEGRGEWADHTATARAQESRPMVISHRDPAMRLEGFMLPPNLSMPTAARLRIVHSGVQMPG